MDLFSNAVQLNTQPERFGELRESNDILDVVERQKERMADDGYLFFRNFLDPDVVLRARREILLKYAVIGEIDSINYPLMDAIQSEHSFIGDVNLVAFTESVMTGAAYENVVLNLRLIDFVERFLGGAVRCFEFKWTRFVRPGEATGFHCDAPYINRGTKNVYSTWIPLGDVIREEGALIVLENSHKSQRLRNNYSNRDADRDRIGWLSTNPVALQNQMGGRWLTTDFKAGDVLFFSMYLVHGSLDNRSPVGRCRLTSDTRYQLMHEPLDERWNGGNMNPHGGRRRVFLPGLGKWNNKNFQDEWKPVDELGRLSCI